MIHPLSDQRKRRPGKVLGDGEAIGFSIALVRDSASGTTRNFTDARAASIDETVKAAIEQQAKLANQKPADWLASAMPREIERLIESAAKAHVSALGGEGIARGFALDGIIRRLVDVEHARHDAKFSFMGDAAPAFDRERAEFLARSKFGGQPGTTTVTTDADVTRTLSAARHNGAAPLVDAEAQPKAVTSPAMHDAGGQAKPATINALRAARYQGG